MSIFDWVIVIIVISMVFKADFDTLALMLILLGLWHYFT